jgi:hypothetical protein
MAVRDDSLYFGVEILDLTPAQANTLVYGNDETGTPGFRHLGRREGGNARQRMHLRIRSDNQAAIFEAAIDTDDLTVLKVRQYLARLFGVNVNTISAQMGVAEFGNGTTVFATFSHSGQAKLRLAAFGGVDATWAESRLETVAYLAQDAAAWNEG